MTNGGGPGHGRKHSTKKPGKTTKSVTGKAKKWIPAGLTKEKASPGVSTVKVPSSAG